MRLTAEPCSGRWRASQGPRCHRSARCRTAERRAVSFALLRILDRHSRVTANRHPLALGSGSCGGMHASRASVDRHRHDGRRGSHAHPAHSSLGRSTRARADPGGVRPGRPELRHGAAGGAAGPAGAGLVLRPDGGGRADLGQRREQLARRVQPRGVADGAGRRLSDLRGRQHRSGAPLAARRSLDGRRRGE